MKLSNDVGGGPDLSHNFHKVPLPSLPLPSYLSLADREEREGWV